MLVEQPKYVKNSVFKNRNQIGWGFCILVLSFLFFPFQHNLHAQEWWMEKTEQLIYSPRYFGPNAFPIPIMREGRASDQYEVSLRGEYHHYTGDKTWDIIGNALLPFFRGKAGIEINWCIKEHFTLTPETHNERHTVDVKSPVNYSGDVVVSSFFQILRNERWLDLVVSANIKTASGGRLCDARFTDAATYWFDLNAGKNLWKSKDQQTSLRAEALVGFYCWMTNKLDHRQNDAIIYGIGLTGRHRNFSLSSNLVGIYGYENNGDRPIHWQNKLMYEVKKNVISLRYTHGIKDNLYNSYSLGYTRCF